MENPKDKDGNEYVECPDQPGDLKHHKTTETDTLVKAERPSDDFMDSHDLDKDTHGRKLQ